MNELPGPLVIDIAGTELDDEDVELLRHPLVGGVILFTRNFESPAQLNALCEAIRALRRDNRLLLTVDHEGGRVQRFRKGFTTLPAAAEYGERHAQNPFEARVSARRHGATLARELRSKGIDMSFAPVLDLGRGLGTVIGDRALSGSVEVVSALGIDWMSGMHDEGMPACGKHFPGHGGVAGDSHEELPVDNRTLVEIETEDMVPFRDAIAAGLDSVMMAHVLFPQVDSHPASLSSVWIRDILRTRLRFTGAVFCDDLSMAGAAGYGSYTDRAKAALSAGCDALPVCNNRDGVKEILSLPSLPIDPESGARLGRLRGK